MSTGVYFLIYTLLRQAGRICSASEGASFKSDLAATSQTERMQPGWALD